MKKQAVQLEPYEDVSDVSGLDKDFLTNIPVASNFTDSNHSGGCCHVKTKPAGKNLISRREMIFKSFREISMILFILICLLILISVSGLICLFQIKT